MPGVKRVTRSPQGSGSCCSLGHQQRKSESKMDSGVRRNDESRAEALRFAPALVSYAVFWQVLRPRGAHGTLGANEQPIGEQAMGRGDRKTRKGKISIRSYGNMRPHKTASANGAVAKKAAPAKPAVKKAAPVAKKAAPKKAG